MAAAGSFRASWRSLSPATRLHVHLRLNHLLGRPVPATRACCMSSQAGEQTAEQASFSHHGDPTQHTYADVNDHQSRTSASRFSDRTDAPFKSRYSSSPQRQHTQKGRANRRSKRSAAFEEILEYANGRTTSNRSDLKHESNAAQRRGSSWGEAHPHKPNTSKTTSAGDTNDAGVQEGAEVFQHPKRQFSPEEMEVRRKNMKSRRFMWGYVRHQYPETERKAAKQAFTAWRQSFERIDTGVQVLKCPEPLREHGEYLFELDEVSSMRRIWEALDEGTRAQTWPQVLLSTLQFCPGKANLVLEATLNPLPPAYAIHDVLLFIARRLDLKKLKSAGKRAVMGDNIVDLVAKTLEDMPLGYVPRGSRTLGLLAKKLPVAQARELYDIVCRSGGELNEEELCHFASKLASSDAHKEVAFGILKDFTAKGADLNEPKFASIVTSLLLSQDTFDGWSQESRTVFSSKDALESLMDRGFSPNIINLTALLSSLCSRGELDEAVRLALLFSETGIQLDAKVFATIFRGAKASLVHENIAKALDVARASETPYREVLNNSLHAVYYFAMAESRDKFYRAPWITPVFGPMLRLYAKKFDMKSLQWWIPDSLPLFLTQNTDHVGELPPGQSHKTWDFKDTIVPAVDGIFSDSETGIQQPNATTLVLMLRGYIKSLTDHSSLLSFYNFFNAQLHESDKVGGAWTEIVSEHGSIVHDALLLALSENKGLFRYALELFSYMLRDTAARARTSDHETDVSSDKSGDAAPVHPAPSQFTFTILLRELLRRGEADVADGIMQVMREHGIEPGLATWNTVLRQHARSQNIDRAVKTLQDLEGAGLQPDVSTLNAFAKIKNQQRALRKMEMIVEQNRARLADEHVYTRY